MNTTIPNNNLPVYLQDIQTTLSYGFLDYLTFGLLPSIKKGKRVAQCNVQCYLSEGTDPSKPLVLTLDFSQIKQDETYHITFEGPIQGTLSYRKELFDASEYISYNYNVTTKQLTMTIQVPIQKRIKRKTSLAFQIIVNDDDDELPVA